MMSRLAGVLALLSTVTASAYAQSASTGHTRQLQLQLGACEAQHKACSGTCATGADCERCDKEWLDCKAKLPVNVDALNVRRDGSKDDGGGKPGRQNDRWHEIDGCSVIPDDPTKGKWGRTSTRFGAPEGHGDCHVLAPDETPLDLPCNQHDVCYQTCGSTRSVCDQQMLDAMLGVCNRAYPETSCPFHGPVANRPCPVADDAQCDGVCEEWYDERERCSKRAANYKTGLDLIGWKAYNARQKQYCDPAGTG